MDESQKKAIEYLVNLPAWNVVMKEVARPYFSDISRASDEFRSLAKVNPAAAYLARILTTALFDDFLSVANQYKAGVESKKNEERFD